MENKMRQGKVTPEMFNAVKICLANGNSISETARFMNMSKGVIGLISKSVTLEEYKAEMFVRARKCHEKRTEKAEEEPAKETKPEEVVKEFKTTVTVQATKYMEEKMGEAVDLLKGISAKLAVIIDDLYGTKTP